MPQYKEDKLQLLLELAEFDYNLIMLSAILGHKKFGEVLKTFSGLTIKFPSEEDIKKIGRKVGAYRRSFQKILRDSGRNTTLEQLAGLGIAISHKNVRKAAKAKITQLVLQEYIKSLYDDDTFRFTAEQYYNLDTDDQLKVYEMSLKELSCRANIFKAINAVRKK